MLDANTNTATNDSSQAHRLPTRTRWGLGILIGAVAVGLGAGLPTLMEPMPALALTVAGAVAAAIVLPRLAVRWTHGRRGGT